MNLRASRGAAFAVIFAASSALAQTATTVGTLTAIPTFDTVWVKATFSGDTNANNSFTLEYKPSGNTTWLSAYAPPPDRRSAVHAGTSNTANQNQFRAGIFGLNAGQSYDVRVTYIDADGVTGAPELSSLVTLLSKNTVARGGGTFYLDDVATNGNGSSSSPFNSFANAFAGTVCGDKLIVRAGTYSAFTFSKACSNSTWYVIEGIDRDTVLINNAPNRVISIDGNFVQFRNLRLPMASCSGIEIASNRHDVWVENVRIDDVGTSFTTIGHTAAYGCDGIRLNSGNHDVYLFANIITGATLTASGPADPHWDTCCNGIAPEGSLASPGRIVIKGNTITGGFRDAIGNSPESPPGGMDYSDIIDNIITNHVDDGIQMEGTDVNLLVQGNTVQSNIGFSCFAAQTAYFGPIYWLRNTCRLTWTNGPGGAAWKVGGLQMGFLFHNSAETTGSPTDCIADSDGATDTSYITARNNIFKCQANPLYRIYATGTNLDFNLYYRASGTTVASSWNGSSALDLAGLRAIMQEKNGRFEDPQFVDTMLRLKDTSRAVNAGVAIPNINNAVSAWPSQGIAPDLGAFEFGAPVRTPGTPANLRIQ